MQKRIEFTKRFLIGVLIVCVLLLSGFIGMYIYRVTIAKNGADGGMMNTAVLRSDESYMATASGTTYGKFVYANGYNGTEPFELWESIRVGDSLESSYYKNYNKIAAHWNAYMNAPEEYYTWKLIGVYDETDGVKVSNYYDVKENHVYIPLLQMTTDGAPLITRGYWSLEFMNENLLWQTQLSCADENESSYNLNYGDVPNIPTDKGDLVASQGLIASEPQVGSIRYPFLPGAYCRPSTGIVPWAVPYYVPDRVEVSYVIRYSTPKITVTNNLNETTFDMETRSDAIFRSMYYNNPQLIPPVDLTQEMLRGFTGPAINLAIYDSRNFEWLSDKRLFGGEISVDGKPYVPIGYETNMTRVPNCIENGGKWEPSDDLLATSIEPKESYYLKILYGIKTYAITFEYMVDDSGAYKSEVSKVVHGDIPIAPELPKLSFLSFLSWNYAIQPAQADTVYRADYDYIKFRVTYYDFDGNVVEVKSLDITSNVINHANSVRNDKRFGGWTTKKGSNNAIAEDYKVNSNLSLYPVVKEYTGDFALDMKYHPFKTLLRLPDYILDFVYDWLYKIDVLGVATGFLDGLKNVLRIGMYIGFYGLLIVVIGYIVRLVIRAVRSIISTFRVARGRGVKR